MIEHADGTYIELDTPEACEAWAKMADAQAMSAFVHGYKGPELPWKTGSVAEREQDRRLVVAGWIHTRAMEYHDAAEKEIDRRKADFNSVIHDALLMVADGVRRGEYLK